MFFRKLLKKILEQLIIALSSANIESGVNIGFPLLITKKETKIEQ